MTGVIAAFIVIPVTLAVNYTTMFLTLPRRYGLRVSIAAPVAFTVVYGFALHLTIGMDYMFGGPRGLVHLPLIMLLFKGQLLQKVFAFFLQLLFTRLQASFAGFIAGFFTPPGGDAYFQLRLIVLSAMYSIYITLVYFFGRRVFQKLFVAGQRTEWALYAFGAVFSFSVLEVADGAFAGADRVMFLLFILWSFGILCFAVVNTHEKTAAAHSAETLSLQMSAMRNQVEAENEYRKDTDILRHDMRHEMGVIMELFRAGKSDEAERVYADWLGSLSASVPAAFCADPVLNAVLSLFERRARDKDIRLDIDSRLSSALQVDTIKLSVVLSNALENALTAADKVKEKDRRAVRVKFIYNDSQFGFEIINPCAEAVTFDDEGIPVAREAGHGVGVRSVVAFAKENNSLLDFKCADDRFTMRLIVNL